MLFFNTNKDENEFGEKNESFDGFGEIGTSSEGFGFESNGFDEFDDFEVEGGDFGGFGDFDPNEYGQSFIGQESTYKNESYVKRCDRCDMNFTEEMLMAGQETCLMCGSKLINLTENTEVKPSIIKEDKSPKLKNILTIDKYGYMHFIDNEEENRYKGKDRLKICINGIVCKSEHIHFDEYTLGRNSTTFCPDIDLSKFDYENRISRKHLMIYRKEDTYFVRNLSSKNTVHVNGELLGENDSKEIENNDTITLSNFIECKFEIANI